MGVEELLEEFEVAVGRLRLHTDPVSDLLLQLYHLRVHVDGQKAHLAEDVYGH